MYNTKIKIREELVDGVKDWVWAEKDTGAWEGPSKEWPVFKDLYLNNRKGSKVAIQAGGNLGLYPRLLSDIFDVVYTFEPDSFNFYCLVNNCQKENIIKINAALGNSHVMIDLNRPSDTNLGMHKIDDPPAKGIIPVLMIDDFNFEACDLIQLDVERYELQALLGGIKTIEKFRPLISVECATDEITEFLRSFNYEVVGGHAADTLFAAD